MANPTIKIHNLENGQIEEREMTKEELATHLENQKLAKLDMEENKKLLENRLTALAKLAALGLTEDEIAAL